MNFDLTNAEAEALAQEIAGIVESARYPLSPRVQTLRAATARFEARASAAGGFAGAEGLCAAVERAVSEPRLDDEYVMTTIPERQPTNAMVAVAGWKILPESQSGYFGQLGRMVATYARAEAGVHLLARHLSGLPDAEARAQFSGMRLSDLTKLVRGKMRTNDTPWNIYREVNACLVQLGVIANQRNKLVHRMVEHTGSHLSVSNALTASLAKIEADSFSKRDLRRMALDCAVIFLRLLWVIAPSNTADAKLVAVARKPWRYKPPRQIERQKQ